MISVIQDTLQTNPDAGTPYDSVWAQTGVPTSQPEGLERVMLAEDKLYVVLAIVLIIWFGITYFILRTDRKLTKLERSVESGILSDNPEHT
jgi:CcmD family protein